MSINEGLKEFLAEWDNNYLIRAKHVPLFDSAFAEKLNHKQKSYFAKVFYHARGHFHNFLWFMGNHATNKLIKDIILQNIAEELGGNAKSHEQLYFLFAEAAGADIESEFVEEKFLLPFVKQFNKGHLNWLRTHDQESQLSAFSAYERLDNVDYVNLLQLVENMGIKRKGLFFFKVHAHVQHFETTLELLNEIWQRNQKKVWEAYNFIADHQINMWQKLSQSVLAHKA
ncbi:MAG: iron-containing redox enzyme family protein [Alphaproteobacteria bacterium]|nr:iron-containing redox enzyme family protein [Alphaproteobacteria bacterium]